MRPLHGRKSCRIVNTGVALALLLSISLYPKPTYAVQTVFDGVFEQIQDMLTKVPVYGLENPITYQAPALVIGIMTGFKAWSAWKEARKERRLLLNELARSKALIKDLKKDKNSDYNYYDLLTKAIIVRLEALGTREAAFSNLLGDIVNELDDPSRDAKEMLKEWQNHKTLSRFWAWMDTPEAEEYLNVFLHRDKEIRDQIHGMRDLVQGISEWNEGVVEKLRLHLGQDQYELSTQKVWREAVALKPAEETMEQPERPSMFKSVVHNGIDHRGLVDIESLEELTGAKARAYDYYDAKKAKNASQNNCKLYLAGLQAKVKALKRQANWFRYNLHYKNLLKHNLPALAVFSGVGYGIWELNKWSLDEIGIGILELRAREKNKEEVARAEQKTLWSQLEFESVIDSKTQEKGRMMFFHKAVHKVLLANQVGFIRFLAKKRNKDLPILDGILMGLKLDRLTDADAIRGATNKALLEMYKSKYQDIIRLVEFLKSKDDDEYAQPLKEDLHRMFVGALNTLLVDLRLEDDQKLDPEWISEFAETLVEPTIAKLPYVNRTLQSEEE